MVRACACRQAAVFTSSLDDGGISRGELRGRRGRGVGCCEWCVTCVLPPALRCVDRPPGRYVRRGDSTFASCVGGAGTLEGDGTRWLLAVASVPLYSRDGFPFTWPPADGWQAVAGAGVAPAPSVDVYHGSCTLGCGACVCHEGFVGADCAIGEPLHSPPPHPLSPQYTQTHTHAGCLANVTCSGNGECTAAGGCACRFSFSGPHCETCGRGGVWTNGTCVCTGRFHGPLCDQEMSWETVALIGGSIVAVVCVCASCCCWWRLRRGRAGLVDESTMLLGPRAENVFLRREQSVRV